MRDLSSPAWTPRELILAYQWRSIQAACAEAIIGIRDAPEMVGGLEHLIERSSGPVGGIDASKSIWANHTLGYDFQENVWP